MSLRPFQYAEPESLEEAVSLLSENGSRVLAGGSDLLSEMKEGVVAPDVLVSLAGIEDLRGVEVTPEGVRIGAMTSLAALAANTEVQQRYPVLAEAAGGCYSADTQRWHIGGEPVPAAALLLLP